MIRLLVACWLLALAGLFGLGQCQEQGREQEAAIRKLTEEGARLFRANRFPAAEEKWRAALDLQRKRYPAVQFPEGHSDLADSLNSLAYILHVQGKFDAAGPLYEEALAMQRRLYPAARYPHGHAALAASVSNLAELRQDQGQLPAAETLCREALAMRQRLAASREDPETQADLAMSLNNLAALLQAQGKFTAAEPFSRQALARYRRLYPTDQYPDGHPQVATSMNNLAELLRDQGQLGEAEALLREALAMRRRLYPVRDFPQGHPALARSLNSLAALFQTLGKSPEAEALYRDALDMRRSLYPPAEYPHGHPEIARSLNNLADLLQTAGKLSAAEPLYHEALAMTQALYPVERYPHGHRELALCLNNVASVQEALGKLVEGERRQRQALAMFRRLFPPRDFPQGHPRLATAVNNLASLLQERGLTTEAGALYLEALQMRQRLYPPTRYPNGHPDLAASLNNAAYWHQSRGEFAEAQRCAQDALAMFRKLYPPEHFPEGHPLLARTLSNLGGMLRERGRHDAAEARSREALAMLRHLALHHAWSHEDGEVLTLLASWPLQQDEYLSLLQEHPALGVQGYAEVWAHRALLTRLAEQKRMAIQAAALPPDQAKAWEELSAQRRRRSQLLLAVASSDPETTQARDAQLAECSRRIEALSAQVRSAVPALREYQRHARGTPADLQKVLPPRTVFLDLLRYQFFEFDPTTPGLAAMKRSPRYAAFVVTQERIDRVDLGPAEPIDAALRQWREEIAGKSPRPISPHAVKLRQLLWEPLEKQLPGDIATVYLCPDQQTCFLPWAALPGKRTGSILLEDYGLNIVPHGAHLLAELAGMHTPAPKSLEMLVVGGVSYEEAPASLPQESQVPARRSPPSELGQRGIWSVLPGTATEARFVAERVPGPAASTQRLTRTEASAAACRQALPQARRVHLATHGFFAEPRFRSVLQLDERRFTMRGQERVGVGAQLPSLLSGLVFAGANRPDTPGRGMLTAEDVSHLDLQGMELAVLSACDTGLGEVAGGEGVFGLQRAFHVAGCRNVIASLWKVNDVATLVLMEEFYRNLWDRKLAPRDALRQAQLTVYRQPDRVLQRAEQMGVRGIEEEAAPLPAGAAHALRRSPTAWWAAFVLSGIGE